MTGRLLVAAVLALALTLRLGVAVLHDPPPARGDAADFARHAAALADDGTYPQSAVAPAGGPTAFRPPAYPFALAAVYEVAGRDDAPRVFGALLGTLAVALLGACALPLLGGRVAVAAMALAAVFPPLIMVSVAQLSEALFIVLVLGALACAVRRPERLGWVVAAGALAGAAALTRTNGLAILLPLILAVPRGRRLALVAAALVVIAPWAIRSSTALDALVPTTTQPGFALAGAYNDSARNDERFPAAWRPPVVPPYARLLRDRDANEAELEQKFRSEALSYAAEHPLHPPRVLFWATVRMLNLADPELERISAREAGAGNGFVTLNRYAIWVLLALAVAGALTRTARAAPRWLLAVPAPPLARRGDRDRRDPLPHARRPVPDPARRDRDRAMAADVAVIIPARDAAATLPRTLAALEAQQDAPPFEVHIAHDVRGDGPAAARNRGVAATTAPLLAFTDADCFPEPDWLARGAAALDHADLVQGAVLPERPPGPFDRTVSVRHAHGLFETANLLCRRELFVKLGGFEERWLVPEDGKELGEDVLLGWKARRAGAGVTFAPEAVVRHAVFPRSAHAFVAERARLAAFPALADRIPELRSTVFHRRWFLSERSMRFDAALAGLATGQPLLAVPYLGRVARDARREGGRAAAARAIADAASLGALVRGSARHRCPLF